jgi:hypothetical protein
MQPLLHNGPYPGLRPYNETEAEYFFGRQKETRIILANSRGSRVTVVHGPTHVGITSILRAGVIPALQQTGVLPIYFTDWEGDVLSRLLSAIDGAAGAHDGARDVVDALSRAAAVQNKEIVLILDQFGAYTRAEPSSLDYLERQLAAAICDNDLPVNVVFALGNPGFDSLLRLQSLVRSIFQNCVSVEHLTSDQAYDAILQPWCALRSSPEEYRSLTEFATALIPVLGNNILE